MLVAPAIADPLPPTYVRRGHAVSLARATCGLTGNIHMADKKKAYHFRRIGSCLKFVRGAPLTLRLHLRYTQDEWGRVCIGTDSVHEPKNSGLCGAHLAFLQRMKHATSLTRSLRVGWNYLWIIV
jgi:hypothetical protein